MSKRNDSVQNSGAGLPAHDIPTRTDTSEVTVRIGFIAALLVLAVISIISYRNTNVLVENQRHLTHLHRVYALLHDIEVNAAQAQLNARVAMMTGDKEVQNIADSAAHRTMSRLSLLRTEIASDPDLKDDFTRLSTQITQSLAQRPPLTPPPVLPPMPPLGVPPDIAADRNAAMRLHQAINRMQMKSTAQWEAEEDGSEQKAFRTFQVILLGGVVAIIIVMGAISRVDSDAKARRIAESERTAAVEALRRREELLKESEERFRGLIEDGSDVICLLDARGRIEYLSPSAERVLEHRNGDVMGQEFFRFIHPEDRMEISRRFCHIAELPGRSMRVEARVRCKNGGWRNIEAAATNRMDRSGLCGIVINARDVTDRKRIEGERERLLLHLQQSEARLREVMSNANCLLWEATVRETRYVEGTDAPTEWIDTERQTYPAWDFWLADEEIALRWVPITRTPDQSFSKAFYQARLPEYQDSLSIRALRENLPGYSDDFQCRMADGSLRWIHEDVTLTPLPLEEEDALRRWRMVGVLTDVTERHSADTMREQLLQELRTSEARLRDITSRANCLLWEATVVEGMQKPNGIEMPLFDAARNTVLNWDLRVIDEESALQRLPVAIEPGQRFADAWYHAFPGEARAAADSRSLAALRNNLPGYTQTFPCRMADGSTRWIQEDVTITPLIQNPRTWQVVGVCLDVTERKQNEAAREAALTEREGALRERARALVALRESEGALRGFFDSASLMMGILEFDSQTSNLSLIRQNAAVLRFYGINPETRDKSELERMPDMRQVALQEFDLWKQQARQGLELRAPVRFEYQHIAASGNYWLAATLCHIGQTTEGRDRFSYIVDDITAQKQDAERLLALTNELQRSNRELSDFTSIASHDLQEPLRKIQTLGSMLQRRAKNELSPDTMGYVERMLSAAARMQTLIDDLMSLSRVTTAAKPFAAVDLNQIVSGVLEDLEARIERTEGRVEIAAPLPTLQADPLQMRQLLQNLIGNALKYHRENVPPVVRVAAEIESDSEPRMLRLTVSDNGIGFEPRFAERIFGMFERLEGHSRYEGTGIGLAICRKIVERHGGTISADSTVGFGSTFTVRLPMRRES